MATVVKPRLSHRQYRKESKAYRTIDVRKELKEKNKTLRSIVFKWLEEAKYSPGSCEGRSDYKNWVRVLAHDCHNALKQRGGDYPEISQCHDFVQSFFRHAGHESVSSTGSSAPAVVDPVMKAHELVKLDMIDFNNVLHETQDVSNTDTYSTKVKRTRTDEDEDENLPQSRQKCESTTIVRQISNEPTKLIRINQDAVDIYIETKSNRSGAIAKTKQSAIDAIARLSCFGDKDVQSIISLANAMINISSLHIQYEPTEVVADACASIAVKNSRINYRHAFLLSAFPIIPIILLKTKQSIPQVLTVAAKNDQFRCIVCHVYSSGTRRDWLSKISMWQQSTAYDFRRIVTHIKSSSHQSVINELSGVVFAGASTSKLGGQQDLRLLFKP